MQLCLVDVNYYYYYYYSYLQLSCHSVAVVLTLVQTEQIRIIYINETVQKHITNDMIYLLTAIGLSPGGSSTVHIYTQTIHRTTQITTEQHK